MKYIFGPVPSRRLGFSLGLDLVPFKTCTYDCIYCELGRTTHLTIKRQPYVKAADIIKELKAFFDNPKHPPVDYITIGGSGEPTLNSEIGTIIQAAKALNKAKVAVLTNGSLIWQDEVKEALLDADLVLPSLDAVSDKTWRQVNRPHPLLKNERIIVGLKSFRKVYQGEIWLEVLLVKGINDNEQEIKLINETIQQINPDRIQLNTVVRPPAESNARPLSKSEMERIKDILGPKAEIIANFQRHLEQDVSWQNIREDILEMLKRRPCTLEDISMSLGIHRNEVVKFVDELQRQGQIQTYEHSGKRFFVVKTN